MPNRDEKIKVKAKTKHSNNSAVTLHQDCVLRYEPDLRYQGLYGIIRKDKKKKVQRSWSLQSLNSQPQYEQKAKHRLGKQQSPIYAAIFCSLTGELKHSVSLVLKRRHLTQLISLSRRHNTKRSRDAAVGSSWTVAHWSWSRARGLKHAAWVMMVISFCWENVLLNC